MRRPRADCCLAAGLRAMSLAQCQMVASGRAAQCINNPYYGRARRRC